MMAPNMVNLVMVRWGGGVPRNPLNLAVNMLTYKRVYDEALGGRVLVLTHKV